MKYLKSFKSKTDAVGQSMPIPSVLSIDNMEDKVGYLNTDIGLKETNIADPLHALSPFPRALLLQN